MAFFSQYILKIVSLRKEQVYETYMSSIEIRQHILEALDQMPLIQQVKLLKYVKSMLAKQQKNQPKSILKFAGIFNEQDSQDFELALKDFEQIDEDGW